MQTNPILIIDSGIGGLYLYHLLKQHLPFETIYYLADSAYFPYGNKSKNSFLKDLSFFFLGSPFDPKLTIIACNSLSLSLQESSRDRVINPLDAIELLEANFDKAKILSTEISTTLRQVKDISLDNLAAQIEYSKPIHFDRLEALKNSAATTFILGCTHYSWIQNDLRDAYPKHTFIDPANLILQQTIRCLKENHLFSSSQTIQKDRFFSTGNTEEFQTRAKRYLDVEKETEIFQKAVF